MVSQLISDNLSKFVLTYDSCMDIMKEKRRGGWLKA